MKTALLLAISLNRILILPKFHCHVNELAKDQLQMVYNHPKNICTLNAYWCVRTFDSVFKDRYREHISFWNCL